MNKCIKHECAETVNEKIGILLVTLCQNLSPVSKIMGPNSCINSMAPRRYGSNFVRMNFKPIIQVCNWVTCCGIALRRMPLNLTNDFSALILVMAWHHQATGHYLNQCRPRSMWSYVVTGPWWVKHNRIYVYDMDPIKIITLPSITVKPLI